MKHCISLQVDCNFKILVLIVFIGFTLHLSTYLLSTLHLVLYRFSNNMYILSVEAGNPRKKGSWATTLFLFALKERVLFLHFFVSSFIDLFGALPRPAENE